MIYLYSGTPGSGKSCHQAENIIFGLKHGKFIIANYSINTDLIKKNKGYFFEVDNIKLKPNYLVILANWWFETHSFKEGAISLYIDEAQLLFNAREWGNKDRAEWLKFFTQHRKYGFNVYLIAQNDRMLDRQIRSVIEYECIHRKLSNFGLRGYIMNILLGGGTYVSVNMWYPMKEKIDANFHHFRKKYFQLYDSYKSFETQVLPGKQITSHLNKKSESLEKG